MDDIVDDIITEYARPGACSTTPSFRSQALITRGHSGANRQWLSVAQYREFRHLADSQECHSVAQESGTHDSPVAKPHDNVAGPQTSACGRRSGLDLGDHRARLRRDRCDDPELSEMGADCTRTLNRPSRA